MKVFIVQAGGDEYHEGGRIIGAYSLKEKAEESKNKYEKQVCSDCDHKYTAYIVVCQLED